MGEEVSRKRFSTTHKLKQEVSKACVAYLQFKVLVNHKPFDSSFHYTTTLQDIEEEKTQLFIRSERIKRGFPLTE